MTISIKKEGTKHCMYCSKNISLKDEQFVLIGTYNRVQKPDDEQYFHFTCFVDWFNQKVKQKAENNVKMMQGKAMELFNNPMIKGMLSQIQGSGNVLSMLSTPLEIDIPKIDVVNKISEKIKDERTKKRSGKNRKTQVQKV